MEVVLDAMAKHRKRINSHGAYEAGMIILDSDRISADRQHGRDPQEGLSDQNVKLVFLEPNLEGLFVRFHIGMERKSLTASDPNRQIRRLWPQYSKPCNEAILHNQDLQRVAFHDANIGIILDTLKLPR